MLTAVPLFHCQPQYLGDNQRNELSSARQHIQSLLIYLFYLCLLWRLIIYPQNTKDVRRGHGEKEEKSKRGGHQWSAYGADSKLRGATAAPVCLCPILCRQWYIGENTDTFLGAATSGWKTMQLQGASAWQRAAKFVSIPNESGHSSALKVCNADATLFKGALSIGTDFLFFNLHFSFICF